MRLFIAVNFNPEIRAQLADYSRALQALSRKARPTRAENFHLTLAFLGECPDETGPRAALQSLSGAPFKLYSGKLGHFQRSVGGNIYWLGLKPSPELLALQAELVKALRAAGSAIENRPFRPHLTLAREVEGCREAELPEAPRFIQRVASIELMESARIDGKLTYTQLYSQELTE